MNKKQMLEVMADRVEQVCYSHRAPVQVMGGRIGPVCIEFDLILHNHTRYKQVQSLSKDIAIALNTSDVRLSTSSNGVVLQFSNPDRGIVEFNTALNGKTLPPYTALLGLGTDNIPLLANISSSQCPHILIASTTGGGKSVLMRTIIASLILHNRPSSLSLVCIDPKGRLTGKASSRHFLMPTVESAEDIQSVLSKLVALMTQRDKDKISTPRIVIFIDELADVIMTCDGASQLLERLLQRGRESGLHVIGATQRPSAAVLSGVMRSNFPLRICGRVVSAQDSLIATGIKQSGAELLAGRGDFLAISNGNVTRFQVPFLDVKTLEDITRNLQQGSSGILLPEVERQVTNEIDNVEILAQKLLPFYIAHSNEYGFKTMCVKHLFGDVSPAGHYWQQTLKAIAICNGKTSSTTLQRR